MGSAKFGDDPLKTAMKTSKSVSKHLGGVANWREKSYVKRI